MTTLFRVRNENGQVLFDDVDHTDRVTISEGTWLLAGEPEAIEVTGSEITVVPGTAIVPPEYPPADTTQTVWHTLPDGSMHVAGGPDCHEGDPPKKDGWQQ